MATTKRRVYVVICGYWTYNDEFYRGDETPTKAFTTREKAEAYVRAWQAFYRSPDGRRELDSRQGEVRYQIVETEIESEE